MSSFSFEKNIILTEYIRNQIHHPENIINRHFTDEELKESIDLMRKFIEDKSNMIEEP